MYPVIAALDTDVATALEFVKKVDVAGFKVGWDLIFDSGISIVSEIAKYGNVIVDVKIADVPHIANRIIEKLILRGACCVIIHGFLYPSIPKSQYVYVLVKMTAPTLYDKLWVDLVSKIGDVRGFVLPGNSPEAVEEARRQVGCRYRIISPGIGAQGGAPGDALKAGADFEIVGRYLLESPDRIRQWSGYRPTCFNTP